MSVSLKTANKYIDQTLFMSHIMLNLVFSLSFNRLYILSIMLAVILPAIEMSHSE